MKAVFKNGHIHTMNPNMPFVSAMAVEDNKIVYVGNDAGAASFEAGATVVDLAGKMVIPGMYDAHCHPMIYAFLSSGIMLNAEMTQQDVLDEITQYVKDHPNNERYFGQGYPEWVFDSNGPRKEQLDAICSDKPMFIMSNGGHEGWCNSKTLEVLKIDKDYPDAIPGYSYVRRDANGDATGNIIEIPAEEKIISGIPWFDPDSITQNYHKMFDRYSSLGVTSLVDCGVLFPKMETGVQERMKEFEDKGELKQRFNGSVFVGDNDKLKTAVETLKGYNAKYNTDLLNFRTLKIINDGTVESLSASMLEPYTDGTVASPMAEGDELYAPCRDAAANGFNIHIHGIGDRTIRETLNVGRRLREDGFYDTRIVSAHTIVANPADLGLFAKYNVLANTSSIWHYMPEEGEENFIGDRFDKQYMMGTILKNGGRVTLGSDLPFDEMGNEPLRGIQMGATRQLVDQPDMPILKPVEERMSVHQCLQAYTINAAYQTHMDDKLGSLEVGKYADFVILEKDLYDIDVYDIFNTKILLTVMNGNPTHVADEFKGTF